MDRKMSPKITILAISAAFVMFLGLGGVIAAYANNSYLSSEANIKRELANPVSGKSSPQTSSSPTPSSNIAPAVPHVTASLANTPQSAPVPTESAFCPSILSGEQTRLAELRAESDAELTIMGQLLHDSATFVQAQAEFDHIQGEVDAERSSAKSALLQDSCFVEWPKS